MRQIISLQLLFFCSLFPALLIAQPTTPDGPKLRSFVMPEGATYLPGRLVLKIKPEYRHICSPDQINIPALNTTLNSISAHTVSQTFPGMFPPESPVDVHGRPLADLSLIYTIPFDTTQEIETVINRLYAHPEVAYAEPLYAHEIFYQPNDPLADTTVSGDNQWYLNQIQAREAWDLQRGDSSIVIGVVDAGTLFGHPDMEDNLAINKNDPIDGIDNDGDGYQDNYFGWDFGGDYLGSLGDNRPDVGNVHGFWVAGTFGATTDNQIGLAGVGFNCHYLPIKASPDTDLRNIYFGYQGIIYAVAQGAQIVNCSWGGSNYTEFGADVVRYATINKSVAVIAAAGNSNADEKYYPAAFPEVISVAGSYYGDTMCCKINNPHLASEIQLSIIAWISMLRAGALTVHLGRRITGVGMAHRRRLR